MTTQSYPLVVCDIIEIPSNLRMINFRCKVAWEMFQDVPSLKFSQPSNSSNDMEFHCEEVEGKCEDENKISENDLQDGDNEEQIRYSDIIFSIPSQRQSGDGEVLPGALDNDQPNKCEDEAPGLQSMLLNNFVTDIENNPGKKSLSRRRLRKSLIDNNL